ncbi:MAG: ATP synthase F0 subunit C [Bacteroidaceae bacterium]|jgi:F-type H+-transporting ATPase subunit c|nr:ATP synthase F0 subunit C [Bacteroidaceae bacterium]
MLSAIVLQAAAGAALGTAGIAIGAALAAFAGAFGISKIGKATMDASARQPESANGYRLTAIIIAALVEGASLFAILVCLLALNK